MSQARPGHPRVVASLTSIPKRLTFLEPTLECLRQQSWPLDAIYVVLPEYYVERDVRLRDSDIPACLHRYATVLRPAVDGGPISKLAHVLDVETAPDTFILTVDDDMLYDRDTVRHLVEAHSRIGNPTTAIGYSGLRWRVRPSGGISWPTVTINQHYDLTRWGGKGPLHPYRRIKMWPKDPQHDAPNVCVLQGYCGALYPRRSLPASSADLFLWINSALGAGQSAERVLDARASRVDDITISAWLSHAGAERRIIFRRLPGHQMCSQASIEAISNGYSPGAKDNSAGLNLKFAASNMRTMQLIAKNTGAFKEPEFSEWNGRGIGAAYGPYLLLALLLVVGIVRGAVVVGRKLKR